MFKSKLFVITLIVCFMGINVSFSKRKEIVSDDFSYTTNYFMNLKHYSQEIGKTNITGKIRSSAKSDYSKEYSNLIKYKLIMTNNKYLGKEEEEKEKAVNLVNMHLSRIKYFDNEEVLEDGTIKAIVSHRKTNNWYANDFGNNLKFNVNCVVEQINHAEFKYNYNILNAKKSKYPIWQFIVEVPFGSLVRVNYPEPDEIWWKEFHTNNLDDLHTYNKLKVFEWMTTSTKVKSNYYRVHPMRPGNSVVLSFESKGGPGIVSCFATGDNPNAGTYAGYHQEGDPGFILPKAQNRLGEFGYLEARTVGPVKLPWDDDPVLLSDKTGTMIDRLTGYMDESYNQGWIESTNIRDWLKGKLAEIKKQNGAGDKVKAKAALDEILVYIEPYKDKDKGILTEAYGLLKYNLEYVRDELLK